MAPAESGAMSCGRPCDPATEDEARNSRAAPTRACVKLPFSWEMGLARQPTFGATPGISMFSVRAFALVLLYLAACGLQAQPVNDDCANALALCNEQPMTGNNVGALSTMPAFCQPGGEMVWFTFTTNSVGGPVQVTLDNLNCAVIPGMGRSMSVAVLSGDGSCAPTSFQVVSGCVSDSVAFTSTTPDLLPSTTYWIVVGGMTEGGNTMSAECSFTVMVDGPGADIVGVDFSAGPDVSIAAGASTQLHATGGTTYSWSPPAGLSGNSVPDPIAQPGETTAYTVTTEIDGCPYTDTVMVWVAQLVLPVNTFTPNGDGINDVWEVPELANYPQAEVSIYDRWGQRVFHSIGYRDPFDGKGLPAATYYWYIQVNDVKGKSDPYTGYVTIVR